VTGGERVTAGLQDGLEEIAPDRELTPGGPAALACPGPGRTSACANMWPPGQVVRPLSIPAPTSGCGTLGASSRQAGMAGREGHARPHPDATALTTSGTSLRSHRRSATRTSIRRMYYLSHV
jgi:hypothetical protein